MNNLRASRLNDPMLRMVADPYSKSQAVGVKYPPRRPQLRSLVDARGTQKKKPAPRCQQKAGKRSGSLFVSEDNYTRLSRSL
jgi:hypothetical protein